MLVIKNMEDLEKISTSNMNRTINKITSNHKLTYDTHWKKQVIWRKDLHQSKDCSVWSTGTENIWIYGSQYKGLWNILTLRINYQLSILSLEIYMQILIKEYLNQFSQAFSIIAICKTWVNRNIGLKWRFMNSGI